MAGLPRHEKLKSLLKDKVVSGQYQPGDRFFSQNDLMKKYGLSLATVTRTLEELVREGYLTRQKGKGTFVNRITTLPTDKAPERLTAHIFSPWSISGGTQRSAPDIYRQLELRRPDDISFKFVPHGIEPDELEPFLFARDAVEFAVFLYPAAAHINFIRYLSESVPTVIVSYSPFETRGISVVTSSAAATELAVAHLILDGHRHIGLVGFDNEFKSKETFIEGYRSALKAAMIPYNERLILFSELRDLGKSGMAALFEANRLVSAVLAVDCVAAVELFAELRSLGLTVPDDVSLICVDEMDKAGALNPPLSAVSYSNEEIADAILDAIQRRSESNGLDTIEVQPVLVKRGSTRVLS